MTVLLPDLVVPADSFQRAYVDYADAVTDAAHDFHLAFGHVALAAALGGRVHIHHHGRRLAPNLFVMALGRSTLSRKSTALNLAEDRVMAACPDAIAPHESTREKWIETLAQRPWQTLFISEYAAWDRAMSRDYNLGSRELFTQLFDGRDFVRQRMTGTANVKAPVVSIGTASTQEWFEKTVADDDVAGGYRARFIYPREIARPRRRGYVGAAPAHLAKPLDRMLHHAHQIPDHEMELAKAARELYDLWLRDHERALERERAVSSQVLALYGRLATYVLKFAMLYQAGLDLPRGIEPRTVDLSAMSSGMAYADRLRAGLAELFEEELATTPYGRAMRRVRESIGENGGIDQWTLTRKTQNLDRALRTRILEDLIDSGDYEKMQVSSGGGRPKYVIRKRVDFRHEGQLTEGVTE